MALIPSQSSPFFAHTTHSLPKELVSFIFSCLTYVDQARAARISKYFHEIIHTIWQIKMAHMGLDARTFRNYFALGLVEPSITTLKKHTSLIHDLVFYKNNLFTCSDDRTINQWDLESEKCIATFKGHQRTVLSCIVNDNFLISASSDCTIKIWEIGTVSLLETIQCSEPCQYGLSIHDGRLIGISMNHITIWDFATRKQLIALDVRYCNNSGFKIYKNKIISFDCEMMKVWDLETTTLLHSYIEHFRSTLFPQPWDIFDDKIIFLKKDHLQIIDINSFTLMSTITGSIKCYAISNHLLVTGGDTIKIWNIKTTTLIATFPPNHKGTIDKIAIHGNNIICLTWHDMEKTGRLLNNIYIYDIIKQDVKHTLLENYPGAFLDFIIREDNLQVIMRDGEGVHCSSWSIESGKQKCRFSQLENNLIMTFKTFQNKFFFISGKQGEILKIWTFEGSKKINKIQKITKNILTTLHKLTHK